jgi:hypothetical protein
MRTTIACLMSSLFLVACGSESLPVEADGVETGRQAASSVNGPITRDEIIARAKAWADSPRAYNMNAIDPATGYRQDCSGYVSMAWHLSTPGLSTVTLPDVSRVINKEDLRLGDAVMNGGPGTAGAAGHVILFAGWSNSVHTRFYAYEQTPPQTIYHDRAYPSSPYKPYRYNRVLEDDPQDLVFGVAPDFDGDGLGDLVGTWANGIMTGYVNTSTEGNPSFNIQKDIDYGWNGITRIVVVDIDNDGRRDLVGTWTNGVMTAYRNLSARGAIYFGNQEDIGSGWQNITKIAVIDIDNDGREDLVGTWTNGVMTAYLNGGTPGNPAFSGQKDIGSGWQNIVKLLVMDADNDGQQDLIGIWKNGTMTAYLNGGTPGNPGFSGQYNIGVGFDAITKIAVVDIDADGKQDLIGTWANGDMTAYLSTGTPGRPGIGNQPSIGSGWNGITKIVVIDVDGDGKQDLLGTWINGVMTAYLSKGTPGQPGFSTQKDIGTGWQGITRIAVVR